MFEDKGDYWENRPREKSSFNGGKKSDPWSVCAGYRTLSFLTLKPNRLSANFSRCDFFLLTESCAEQQAASARLLELQSKMRRYADSNK